MGSVLSSAWVPGSVGLCAGMLALLIAVAPLGDVLAETFEFPDSAVYVRSTTNRSGVPLRWMHSNCVYLRANTAGSADIDDGSDVAAIESAVERWHSATADCSYMRLNLQEATPDAKPVYDNDGPNESVIYWVESDWRHDDKAAGLTILFFVDDDTSSQDGRILDADIELNGRFDFATTGAARATDVENTVAHELGHLFGLDHTCDDGARVPAPKDNFDRTVPRCWPTSRLPEYLTEATMYNFSDPGETKKRSLELGDARGICEIYPLEDDPGVCKQVNPAERNGCVIGGDNPRGWAVTLDPLLLAMLASLWLWRRRQESTRSKGASPRICAAPEGKQSKGASPASGRWLGWRRSEL